MTTVSDEMSLRDLPKVLLHDHLDGGMRSATLIELAAEHGYRRLPTSNHGRLQSWLRGSSHGSIDKVLWAYGHMVAVMQTVDAIERVAREAAEDLGRDNVVYAELRLAPTVHTHRGLSNREVIEAASRGLRSGSGDRTTVRLVLTGMRHLGDPALVADLAVAHRVDDVVGFDLAGIEIGYPNIAHLDAIETARRGGVAVTLHAGDERDLDSIVEAVEGCGATRVGVAYHMVDELTTSADGTIDVGPRAAAIRAAGTHLEICPSASVRMHAITAEQHPVGLLYRAGFSIGINTDSRLLYCGDMTSEFEQVTSHNGFTISDLRTVTLAALDAAFCDDETRRAVRVRVEAGYPPV
jgi:adenosine deaminase